MGTFNTLSTHDKNIYSTLNTNSKRDLCNTLGTYETKRTHITLDTNDSCNTLLHGIAWYCMVSTAHRSFFHFIRLDLIYSVFIFYCPNILFQCSLCVFYV